MPELETQPEEKAGSGVFCSTEKFFSSPTDHVTVDEDDCDVSGDGYVTSKRRVMVFEANTYEVSIRESGCCEGSFYREEWFKNGRLHREGDLPAQIIKSRHNIPEETHLDESVQRFYLGGELQKEIDTTYEDILSGKALPLRQAIGYDI